MLDMMNNFISWEELSYLFGGKYEIIYDVGELIEIYDTEFGTKLGSLLGNKNHIDEKKLNICDAKCIVMMILECEKKYNESFGASKIKRKFKELLDI